MEDIDVEEADMRTPDVATELFAHIVFVMQASIPRIDNEFITGLSLMGRLDVNKVKSIIEGDKKMCRSKIYRINAPAEQVDISWNKIACVKVIEICFDIAFQVKDPNERLERGCAHVEPASLLTGM